MPLDLKQPGNKEYVIFAGGALGLGLLYILMHKKTTAAPPVTPTGATGASATGTGSRVAGGPPTGNAFTDAVTGATSTATGATQTAAAAIAKVVTPVRHTAQGAPDVFGSNAGPGGGPAGVGAPSGGGGSSVNAPGPGETAVYQALIKAGLQPYQAAGIMGNIQNESSFRTEINVIDSNGLPSVGLIQWNAGSYPNAASQYVTGNPAKDFANQIAGIVSLFRSHNIQGTNAGQVAGNWASQIEGCVGCQPGGAQYTSRVFNAQGIYQNVLAGKYNPIKLTANTKGTKAASPTVVAGMFPTVKPKAVAVKPRAKAKAKPVGLARPGLVRSVTLAVVNAFRVPPQKMNRQAAATARAQNRRGIRAV